MKYDSQLIELKNLLPASKNVLIALPSNPSMDQLASALSLFLTLEATGKKVNIVCESDIKVDQAHLFGVNHIQKTLPSTDSGNLVLTLEGVAASDNTVPALEKLDWYAENNNLNLVFHVLPNQTFQPTNVVPHHQGSSYNLIFVVGAAALASLGSFYQQNQKAFSSTHVVNIDSQGSNTSFGQTNIIDINASSVSEIMGSIMTDLGLVLDADSASNLLAGIFDATNNLTDGKAGPDSFMAVANCLRVGGKKPIASSQAQPQIQPIQPEPTPAYDWAALMPKEQPNIPEFTVPPIVQQADAGGDDSKGSPEERPVEEGVISETVEPEWLTPKIFKGSSLG